MTPQKEVTTAPAHGQDLSWRELLPVTSPLERPRAPRLMAEPGRDLELCGVTQESQAALHGSAGTQSQAAGGHRGLLVVFPALLGPLMSNITSEFF